MAVKSEHIGKMDRWIDIKTPTVTRTATGDEQITHTLKESAWAFVEWQTTDMKEKEQGGFDQPSSLVDFTFRYIPGLTPKDIIIYENQTYDILSIIEEGRNNRLKARTRLRQ